MVRFKDILQYLFEVQANFKYRCLPPTCPIDKYLIRLGVVKGLRTDVYIKLKLKKCVIFFFYLKFVLLSSITIYWVIFNITI